MNRAKYNRLYQLLNDCEPATKFDPVVGITIKRSNQNDDCIICAKAEGDYPVDFIWEGWHKDCTCQMYPIIKRPDEIQQDYDTINKGKIPSRRSRNTVHDIPTEFKKFVNARRDLFDGWDWLVRNEVYFFTEVEKIVNVDFSDFDEDDLRIVRRYQKKGMIAAIKLHMHLTGDPFAIASIVVKAFIKANKIPRR